MSCGKIRLLHSRSRSQRWFKISVNVCPDDIFWTTKHFCYQMWSGDAASWAKVSCRRKQNCYLQGQGHSKGWYDQNMTLLAVSSELLNLQQPNLVWWYIIVSQSVLLKNKKRITAFKVKVTAEGQNVNVCPDDIF